MTGIWVLFKFLVPAMSRLSEATYLSLADEI